MNYTVLATDINESTKSTPKIRGILQKNNIVTVYMPPYSSHKEELATKN